MKKIIYLFAILTLLFPSFVFAAEAPKTTELLLLVEENTTNKEIRQISKKAGGTVEDINKLNNDTKLVKLTVNEDDADEITEILEGEESVVFAQPNYSYELTSDVNDPYYEDQWYLDYIEASDAWSDSGNKVTVAVIDSGCQLDHPDLSVLTDKCVSFNGGEKGSFTQWDESDDDNGHGTHVCGIIGATANNEKGIAGVSNNTAQLIVIDALCADSSFKTEDIVLSINYALEQKAKVINFSLGGLYKDYILDDAINNAYENGVTCVCAAGNESSSEYSSPGDAYGAISVMSMTRYGSLASGSNYGVNKDIAAPGAGIYSTYTNSTYKSMSGTSMATPVVTGVVSLMLSQDSSLTPREIKNILYASGKNDNEDLGFGCVNAKKAIEALSNQTNPTQINLNQSDIVLFEGEEDNLEYAVFPASAYNAQVTMTSSNPSVATIDNGVVKGVSKGSAIITVSSGSISNSCNVTVKSYDYTKINSIPYEVNGSWDASDPKVKADKGVKTAFESHMDGYDMNLNKDDKISIKISAPEMTPYLRILRNDTVIAQKLYSGSSSPKVINVAYKATVDGLYRFQIMYYPSGREPNDTTYSLTIKHSHVIQKVEAKEATCTEDGWDEHYECPACGAVFSDEAGKQPLEEKPLIKAAHDWGEASYVWSNDSVTAERTCQKDTTHKETETVKATSEIVRPATSTQTGLVRYTAQFKNSAFTTQVKEVETDKIQWSEPTYTWDGKEVTAIRRSGSDVEKETVTASEETLSQPTCTSTGSVRYFAEFTNPAFTSQTKIATLDKVTHVWSDPVYSWDGKEVTALRSCQYGHSETETVTATEEVIKEATTTETGILRYTANFENSAFKKQTKDITIDKLDILWNVPEYTWNGYSVTAKRTAKESSDIEEETVKATSEEIKKATCTEEGLVKYTAKFKNNAFSTQTKEVVQEKIPHVWGNPAYTWDSNNAYVTAKRTCKYGHAEEETVKTVITKSGSTIKYTAKFNNSAFTTQVKQTEEDKWSSVEYKWATDYKTVTATKTNLTTGAVMQETSSAKKTVIKASTCSTKGSVQYTAEFKDFPAATKTVSLPLAQHEWGQPVYTWAANYKTVTAKRVCKNGHTQTETVDTTSKVTTKPTATKKGVTTYTTKPFTNKAFVQQTKSVSNINPTQICDLSSIRISKITKVKRSFKVKWKKLSASQRKKVKNVQIQYSQYKNFKNSRTKTSSKYSSAATVRNLKSGTIYYVRIRVCNGKHISRWSSVKTIRTK